MSPASKTWDPLKLAEEVIVEAERHHWRADDALRLFFKSLKGGGSREPIPSTEVSRAVFNYYRWLGWTEPDSSILQKLQAAAQLADSFKDAPARVPDSDLICRAVPAWLNDEMDVTASFARAIQAEPKLWLRARKGQSKAAMKAFWPCKQLDKELLQDVLEYVGREDLFKTRAVQTGLVQIQDASSQGVGLLCEPAPGQTWWDACAGEGGKTLHLSDLMDNKGLIWSTDRADWRLKRLKQRAARVGVFNYRSAMWDGGSRLPTKTKFDGVLVDAPCSGVGTWGRNPHARWTTTPTDVEELAELQGQILDHCSIAVKPGGRLVYSVCTLTRSETTGVADAFERAHPEFKPLAQSCALERSNQAAARHWFLPQDHGANGMFVAVWTRT